VDINEPDVDPMTEPMPISRLRWWIIERWHQHRAGSITSRGRGPPQPPITEGRCAV
jgi:hypothetical protein